jgi:ATP-binding protein involved in chromosome partitioning
MDRLMASESAVTKALSTVQDPELRRDLVSLGMVKQVAVRDGMVTVEVQLTTPACPLRANIEKDVTQAVGALEGVSKVVVSFSADVVGRAPGPGQDRLKGVRNVVAVASGKGGVGKSTVAANLAVALQRHGARVGLLDADVFGPSIPAMLGPATQPAETTTEQKIRPAVHFGLKVMSVGFFVEREGAVIWRGPMVHKLLQQFLEDVEWGELDYLLVDLPPGTGDTQLSLSQLCAVAGAVMVTTPQEVAVQDVVRAITMFRKTEIPILGVVENMSHYVCPSCGHKDEIFSRGGGRRLAEEAKVPFLGEIPIDTRIRFGGDAGRPVVVAAPESEVARVFMDIAAAAAGRISTQNLSGPRRSPSLVAIR